MSPFFYLLCRFLTIISPVFPPPFRPPVIGGLFLSFFHLLPPLQTHLLRISFVPSSFFLRFWVPLFEEDTEQIRLRCVWGRVVERSFR